ncbi:hypothetical protein [Streptomyces sp. NPDC051572]|uniref:hypothetical protein n=1 Tax=Streptomyces sp. NPDC051572 TaxID=3155802 RepID=UPI003450E89E
MSANPAPAGMRDVVWNTGAQSWGLTFATTTGTSTEPTTVPHDTVVQVARSITAKLPTGG